MDAARTRLDIAAENLANVSSGGFLKTLARGVLRPNGVSIVREPSHEGGTLRQTGRPFDLAIVGPGAFHVRDARGAVVESRDGAFVREIGGTLRDSQGRTLLARDGHPFHVAENGPIDLARVAAAPGSVVRAGFLETPNVDAISEMIDVVAAQRSFETAGRVVAAIDRVREKAATDVARVA